MKNKLEDLMIYKQYIELISYTEGITNKYPRYELYGLVSKIKDLTYSGMEYIIRCYKEYDKKSKIRLLNELDNNLRFLLILVRVSYKNKFITKRNYASWTRKICNIANLMGGWMKSCQSL